MYYYPCMPNRLDLSSLEMFEKDINWIAEVKRNGWRCLAIKNGDGKLELWTRRKTIIPDPLPQLREELNAIPAFTILDGELIHKRTKLIKETFYFFDIIRFKGVMMHNYTWKERRKIMESVYSYLGEHTEISNPVNLGKRLLYDNNISDDDMEGIVLKKIDAKYPLSKETCITNPSWLKVKKPEKASYV